MKSALRVCCWLIVFLLFFHTTSLADRRLPTGSIIKFGYIPGYGFSLRNLHVASARGYIHQFLARMESFSRHDFAFTPYPNSEALLKALDDGHIDVAVPLAKTPEREAKYLFSFDAVGTAQMMLVSQGDDYGYYRDPSEIHGKTVASFHKSVLEPVLDAYCKYNDFDISYIRGEMLDYHTLDADYYLITSLAGNFQEHDSVLSLKQGNYYLAFRKDSLALQRYLHSVYKKAVMADDALLSELFIKYYKTNLTRRDLTQEEMLLLKGKTFTAGYTEGHAPVQYTSAQGHADGTIVELMNLLAKRYDFEIKYVPYSLNDPDEYHESFDFLISLTGTYSHEREFYRDTDAYASYPFLLITSKEKMQTGNFRKTPSNIGILQYISVDLFDVLDEYPQANVSVYTSLDDMIRDYKAGYLDAFLYTDTGLTYLNAMLGDDLFVFGNSLALPFKLFISRKLNPAYVNVFNVIFDYVTPSEFDEIFFQQSLKFVPTLTIDEFMRKYRYELLATLCVLFGAYIFTVYTLQNRQKIAVLNATRYDTLSGFLTYSFFEMEMTEKLQTAECNEYVIIAIDIDLFDVITTHYSHEIAKGLLRTMSQALDTYVKSEHGLITRTFVDNFLICRTHIEPGELESILQEHVIPKLTKSLAESYPLTLSVGIYPIENCQEEAYIMVDRANMTRIKGKHECKNTVYIFDDALREYYSARINITYRMESALKNNEFHLLFQPKVDFETLKVRGAEALVRWHTPAGEIISPSVFIPIFEENGFIHRLDIYVFTKVCEFLQQYSNYLKNQVISVNISSRTMLESSIVGHLKMIADQYGVSPRLIELEITESAMCEDFALSKIMDFRRMGFAVSIDDFGAGVSSLNRLGNMQADVLKLDKAFLDACQESERSRTVVQDTILMAKHLNMRVVAEGVETLAQAQWLRELTCDLAQGYFFSKPIPPEDVLIYFVVNKTFFLSDIELMQ